MSANGEFAPHGDTPKKLCLADWYTKLIEQEQMSQQDSHKLMRNYNATCMCPRGHEGPHVWTNNEEIGLTLKQWQEAAA